MSVSLRFLNGYIDSNNRNVLSIKERKQTIKRGNRDFKASGGAFGKELMFKGRATVLRVVRIKLEAKHRITRILTVLKIPRTMYYEYLNSKPSDRIIRRQQIKEQLLKSWITYPMYGYPRMTKYFKAELNISVSGSLIYRLMRELVIQSRMMKKMKKPKSYTETAQLPNLIRKKKRLV